jgi:hypothetical protein
MVEYLLSTGEVLGSSALEKKSILNSQLVILKKAILLPRKHLAVPGDILGCHYWGREC